MLMRTIPAPLLRVLSSTDLPLVRSADADATDSFTRRRSASESAAPAKECWWHVGRTRRQQVRSEAFVPRRRTVRVEAGKALNWSFIRIEELAAPCAVLHATRIEAMAPPRRALDD